MQKAVGQSRWRERMPSEVERWIASSPSLRKKLWSCRRVRRLRPGKGQLQLNLPLKATLFHLSSRCPLSASCTLRTIARTLSGKKDDFKAHRLQLLLPRPYRAAEELRCCDAPAEGTLLRRPRSSSTWRNREMHLVMLAYKRCSTSWVPHVPQETLS